VDLEPDEQSGRVSDDMALATLDPLSGIISANPAAFRGFYTVNIQLSVQKMQQYQT
jgi:hypothetical protein